VQYDQLFTLRVRQWFQQNAIHHTKESCVRANTQRQRQQCDQREAGVLAQHTNSITEVLKESAHECFSENCKVIWLLLNTA